MGTPRYKQLIMLEHLVNFRYYIDDSGSEVEIFNAKGPKKKDWSSGYPRISVSDPYWKIEGRKARKINLPVHWVVILNHGLKNLAENEHFSAAVYPEDWEIDHLDGIHANNRIENLRIGPKEGNQSFSRKRQFIAELAPGLEEAIRKLHTSSPNLHRHLLAQSLNLPLKAITNLIN